jgi:hypothetical protein
VSLPMWPITLWPAWFWEPARRWRISTSSERAYRGPRPSKQVAATTIGSLYSEELSSDSKANTSVMSGLSVAHWGSQDSITARG